MPTITRVITSIFAVFFLILSVPMIIGGAACLAVPAIFSDSQGYMNSPTNHLQDTNSYAFISESFTFGNLGDHYSSGPQDESNVYYTFDNFDKIINFRIRADSAFIGLAPTSEVDQYLANVPYSVVSHMDAHSMSTYSVYFD